MQKKLYTITKKDLLDLFTRLSEDYRIIIPYKKGEQFYFGDFDPRKEDMIELGGVRQSQPLKSFLNPAREKIIDTSHKDSKPLIVAGVKACDLSSLLIQDFVFQEGDFKDPFYSGNRQKTVIISSDCTYARQTCFCLAMEGAPYPKKYFDLNLASLEDYFLVEVGSDKGGSLIDAFKTFFKSGSVYDVDSRQTNRDRVADQVKDFIEKRGTPDTALLKGAVRRNYNNTELWQDFSSTCVECGACNLVCPTCHCFILSDEKHDSGAKRYRTWDACLYKSFARVAGGANPRRHLYERLRNRFDKKFDFFPETLGHFACTGCGRCIEACPGDIDIREVLKGLVNGKWNKPPNE